MSCWLVEPTTQKAQDLSPYCPFKLQHNMKRSTQAGPKARLKRAEGCCYLEVITSCTALSLAELEHPALEPKSRQQYTL